MKDIITIFKEKFTLEKVIDNPPYAYKALGYYEAIKKYEPNVSHELYEYVAQLLAQSIIEMERKIDK